MVTAWLAEPPAPTTAPTTVPTTVPATNPVPARPPSARAAAVVDAPARALTSGACPAPAGALHPASPPQGPIRPEDFDQGPLEPDIGRVRAYGEARPREFGGLALVGMPSRIVVAFTADTERHERALVATVANPHRLEVRQVDYSTAELQAVRDTIQAELLAPGAPLRLQFLGAGWQAVGLGLVPGQEALALEYVHRFGAKVAVTLGGHTFVPEGCGPQPEPPRCPDLVGDEPSGIGLELTLVPDRAAIAVGEVGQGTLLVRNLGGRRFTIFTGIVQANLILRATTTAVGRYTGSVAGIGYGLDLEPGEEGRIPILFGAGRCDGRPGSGLPPGSYGLRAVLTATGSGAPGGLLSSETPVTVTG